MKPVIAAALALAMAAPALAQQSDNDSRPRSTDGWTFRWDEHPVLDWSGKLHVEFRARLQGDGRASQAGIEHGAGDRFDVGKRRVGAEASIAGVIDVQVEAELEKRSPWRDAYVNYRPLSTAQVQGGLFKLPFGLEETAGSTKLEFAHRSLASTTLAPGRDRGVMLHGRLIDKAVGYEAGIFANDGDHARPNGGDRVFGGRTIAARLTVEPFRRSTPTRRDSGSGIRDSKRRSLADLQGGVAFTHSAVPEGFPALRGRSVLGVSFFDADVWVRGRRQRTGVQLRWRPGPFSLASEYIRVSDERRGQSLEGGNLVPLLAHGWYVSGAWVVAGASGAADVTEPRRPLLGGGIGSIQVAVRLEQMSFGSAVGADLPSTSQRAGTILGTRENATTIGATWRPNRWLTAQANAIREAIGRADLPAVPHLVFWSQLLRVRLAI